MERAETMLRRALSFNTPASRAEMLTTAWIGLDSALRDAFVLGLITRVAMMPRLSASDTAEGWPV